MESIPLDFLRSIVALDNLKNDARIMDALIIWSVGIAGALTYKDLQALTRTTNGSVSRTVRRLGTVNRLGEAGYGLLETYPDPDEPRRFIVTLSKRGKRLLSDYFGY